VFPGSPVGYALPTPRETRHSVTNPAGTHLSVAGNCSDERGQLCHPADYHWALNGRMPGDEMRVG
jgi:hypothetical protein